LTSELLFIPQDNFFGRYVRGQRVHSNYVEDISGRGILIC